MKSLRLVSALTLTSVCFAVSAQQPSQQCTPDQMSQMEVSVGTLLAQKAQAEMKVRQLEQTVADLSKKLEEATKKTEKPK